MKGQVLQVIPEHVHILNRRYLWADYDCIVDLRDRPANQGGPAFCVQRLNGKPEVYITDPVEVSAIDQHFQGESQRSPALAIAARFPRLGEKEKTHAAGAGGGMSDEPAPAAMGGAGGGTAEETKTPARRGRKPGVKNAAKTAGQTTQ